MRELLSKALSPFVEFQPQQPAPQQPANPQVTSTPQAITPAFVPSVAQSVEINREVFEVLLKAATARRTNFSGLVEGAERLKEIIPDELQRIRAAARMSGDVTTPAIEQAVQLHLADLNNERAIFNRDLAAAKARRVEQPRNRIEVELKPSLKSILDQIEQLNVRHAQVLAEIEAATNEALNAEQTLDSQATGFNAAFAAVEQHLAAQRAAIVNALTK